MVSPKTRRLIVRFVSALREKNISVEKVILYGSHASGRPHADSDIDLAVISPDFGQDRLKESTMLLRMAWRIDPRLEPIAISSESYEKDTWIPLIYEIRQRGIEIKAA
jgi:predicted nucleotidyltransferase